MKIAATLCWLAYAALALDLPVLVASAVGLMTTLAIFSMEASLRFGGARRVDVVDERVLEAV